MTEQETKLTQELASRLIIRPVEEKDLPALEWNGEYRHFRQMYAQAYRRSLRGLSLLWVVELPGQGIVGQVFIQLICDRQEMANGVSRAYLYSFRVLPSFRCKGIGTLMMDFVEADLYLRGFNFLTLNVAKNNPKALRLYQRRGYRIVAHEPGIWSYIDDTGKRRVVEEPAWRMEKRLTPS